MLLLPGLPAVVAAALLTSACGSAEPTEALAAPPQPGCSGPAPAATNPEWEQQVIELVNRQRREHGVPPLKHVTALSDAARWYAKDMVDEDYFGPDHDTYDREGGRLVKVCAWGARVSAYYTGASARAENLAEGSSSPQEVVEGWMGSPGHRANLLNASYWETGVGYEAGTSDEPRWVQEFARRKGVFPLVISDEAARTGSPDVSLYLYGSWTEVRVRNDDGAFSPWRPFSSTLAWRLAEVEGLRTVSVEMRRGSAVATTASDTIVLALSPR